MNCKPRPPTHDGAAPREFSRKDEIVTRFKVSQLLANGPVGSEVDVRGLPIGLRETPGSVRTLGPELGQDTELTLNMLLDYTWEEIAELKEAGVIP